MPFIRRVLHLDGTYLELAEEDYDKAQKKGVVRPIQILGKEQPPNDDLLAHRRAIVWSRGRTIGNIAVHSEDVLGSFPKEKSGEDAVLPCEIIPAGKYRHGKERMWCRTHQVYWGTQADLATAPKRPGQRIVCSNATMPLSYVIDPVIIDPADYPGGVGVWASLPTALSTRVKPSCEVGIHVHARIKAGGTKIIDKTYKAIQLSLKEPSLFLSKEPTVRINATPPAAWSFVQAVEKKLPLDCLMCSYCNEPHLDLGAFAAAPHRKHLCASCGRDSNWSKKAIVSNPLKRVFDVITQNKKVILVDKSLNLDELRGCTYEIWASTPAFVWTMDRPQEIGIHVHAYDSAGREIENDTFGQVILNGKPLVREELMAEMLKLAVQP